MISYAIYRPVGTEFREIASWFSTEKDAIEWLEKNAERYRDYLIIPYYWTDKSLSDRRHDKQTR